MSGVTPERVVELAAGWYPDCADNWHTMLARLRAQAASFVPTWLSALAASGVELPPHLAAEVADSRRRTAALGELTRAVCDRFPEVSAVKGIAVADRYPAELVRHMNDVDLVVSDERSLWPVVEFLRDERGLTVVKSLTRVPLPDGPALLVSVEAMPDDPLQQRINAEVGCFGWTGDGAAVPGRRRLLADRYGPAEHFAMIVGERLEGGFSPKDVVDAAVLGAALDRAAAHRLLGLVTELRALPEYQELCELVSAAGFPVELVEPPAAAVRAQRRQRDQDALRRAVRHPVAESLRLLQRAEIYPCRARGARRAAWRVVERRLPVQSPVRNRLWGFAVPARRIPADLRAGLRTPVGNFVLVNGSVIGAHWQRNPAVEFDV